MFRWAWKEGEGAGGRTQGYLTTNDNSELPSYLPLDTLNTLYNFIQF